MKAIRNIFARLSGHAQSDPSSLPPTRMPRILKGVGKINGDGWKDTTRIGEIVYVWDLEHPKPYMRGQYPRIGNEIWSASTTQYDFTVVPESEYREVLDSIIESVRFERNEIKGECDLLKAAAASRAALHSQAQKGFGGNSTHSEQRPAARSVTAAVARRRRAPRALPMTAPPFCCRPQCCLLPVTILRRRPAARAGMPRSAAADPSMAAAPRATGIADPVRPRTATPRRTAVARPAAAIESET